jgi:hypothetical protein
MRDYDPTYRDPERMISEPPLVREGDSGLTTFGIIAALAVAIGAGMFFFSTGNDNDRVAMNNTPVATTGQSTTAPAPGPDAAKTDSQ